MAYDFVSEEQMLAHWNKIEVAVTDVLSCSAAFVSRRNALDAFFHQIEAIHRTLLKSNQAHLAVGVKDSTIIFP